MRGGLMLEFLLCMLIIHGIIALLLLDAYIIYCWIRRDK